MSDNDQAFQVVKECLHKLGEYFSDVQILATKMDGNQTDRCFLGVGNFYARLGMAHDFINNDNAKETAGQIAAVLKPTDE
jgi:hypothetical protein